MLAPCRCWERACVHFTGVKQPDGTEGSEVNTCKAYPDGIPDSIAYGDDLHLEEVAGDNGVVFERDLSVDVAARIA